MMMMNAKTQSYECCMCGDHGFSYELFRCKVCHFRSQHRYCSNLYPKAESYKVCNWCLLQKDDHDHHHQLQETLNSTTTTPSNNSNSSCSQDNHSNKPIITKKPNHHVNGPKAAKSLKPTSPIKKPTRSPEGGSSPSGQKRIVGPIQDQEKLRRTRSEETSNSPSNSTSRSSGGGPAVIKHVFRNKVRRYKLLDEVSC